MAEAIKGENDINFRAVHAHFVLRGSSLNKWSRARGYNPRLVQYAIRGERRSKRAMRIVRELRRETGL
jgi:hypothetical protein